MEATFWNVGPRLYRFEARSVGQNVSEKAASYTE